MSTSRVRARNDSDKTAGVASRELRNYRIHERIGQEELATIYRATHLTLERPVQVHILRRTDWISASRFQLAARLSAQLSHPNLLPVIDAGNDEHHGDYLVTPLLEAHRLDAILANGPLEPIQVIRIATQLAAALDYLHTQQIIHRDIQPANILLTPQGAAYITNLSLAASPDTPDFSSIEEADYLTPYSAPEQRLDQSEAAAALDIYGLGAVIYHMLSGEIPPVVEAEAPMLAGYNPTLSSAERVLKRMMATQSHARFPSAGSAIDALRQALRTQIDLATEDMEESRWEPSAEWLENPLETVMGDTLPESFQAYLSKSRKRADELHRHDALRRLLNRWSRKGFFRRIALGQLIQPEQIVSYNIYFFDLRTLYETRTQPQKKQRPQKADERNTHLKEIPLNVWDVDVPNPILFETVKPQELVLPNSTSVIRCSECLGSTRIVCKPCHGKGTIERIRKVRNPDNSTSAETITETCANCRGYGKQDCAKCNGNGNIVEEQVFTWARQARLWQNTDDMEELPDLALQKRAELIYDAPINLYEGRWHSVAPLADLLRSAIGDIEADTRLIATELSIRATPITEVDYHINDKPHRLFIIGHDLEVIGNWALLNPERIALAAIGLLVLFVGLMVIIHLVVAG